MKANPGNQAIKEEIRELDFIARRAFFTSQHFNRLAIYYLLGGLVVTVVAFKALGTYREPVPYPDSKDSKDNLIDDANWARKSVTAAGLVLVGFSLILALPWESPLDKLAQTDQPAKVTPDGVQPNPTPSLPTPEEMRQYWPAFRGSTDGIVEVGQAPVDWNGTSGQGIVWKTPVPKNGFSSPIVWENRVFLSGGDKQVREVYCFDAENGELLWTHLVDKIPGSPAVAPKVSSDTGYAAPTMTTDGTRVFAIFSTGDLVALDMEGKRVWGRNLGVPKNPYGHSSSLIRHEDVLLIQYDQEKNDEEKKLVGFVAGLDIDTGTEKWKVPRDFGNSWSSPLLADTGNRIELILVAEEVISYDPKTGKEHWRFPWTEGGEIAPTPVYADGMLYLSCGYDKITALDLKTLQPVWENEDLVPGVCTPLITGGLYLSGLDDGGIICFDAKTGKNDEGELLELWMEETDDGFYASPIMVGEKVYMMDRSGVMHIFSPGKEFKSIGKSILGEEAVCTPAVVGDAIYYRGTKHLFKIGS
jgi:outer membrane protein assembly factor BamB